MAKGPRRGWDPFCGATIWAEPYSTSMLIFSAFGFSAAAG